MRALNTLAAGSIDEAREVCSPATIRVKLRIKVKLRVTIRAHDP
jgi:hypothetical protein